MSVSDDLLERFVTSGLADTVLFMNCAACMNSVHAAAASAARVVVTDRNYAAVRAAVAVANVEIVLGHGTIGVAPDVSADVVAIRTPREKLAATQLLADAFRVLRIGGRCVIAGANREGIKSIATIGERAFGNAEVLGHDSGHRAVLMVRRTDAPVDPAVFDNPLLGHDTFHVIDEVVRDRSITVYSRPGVFSWEHTDDATALLADVMQVGEGDSVLDLGCGSGVLGTVAAALSRTGRVVMVDADIEAVRSARRTSADAVNTECLPSDVASAVIDSRFDIVVTNPPFHAGGRATDLDLPRRFIQDARAVLRPGGKLFLVANRTLPYEREISATFGNVQAIHETARFKILSAVRS